ncbi:DUF3618 domain-containing protein [Corynebacterium ureicelerivorans]|uniref:DUF3618 domain-containing protein n=1 Tax=Corynebacterium ureicelerivorans TaxID=401472 RepID=UPI00264ABD08|nr:DUF3618 domain-containing protein [Corynebacterium ureicelerivorans]MDN8606192.1 DUF3618 domain-containing protein [Corynebacterium ureicelerivorans]
MARDIHDIERDLERTRGQLANTLDELADRTNPKTLAGNAKSEAAGWLQDSTVQKVLGGIVAGIVALIGIKAYNGHKRKSELKELQKLLANR